MTLREKSSYKDIVKLLLNKMPGINRPQFNFMTEIFGLFLSIKGRINFLQLQRYGNRCEQSYRSGFTNSFDFLTFNQNLVEQQQSKRLMIAFDPSYVRKSGKHTPGVGYWWSGVSGAAKWGLEIAGIAAVDLDSHAAYHLEAVQTPASASDSLITHYAKILLERKEKLQLISTHIVADAYFSKFGFVSQLTANGFEVISRLRDDADLQYLYTGAPKKGRGRPRKYDGKVRYDSLKEGYFTHTKMNDTQRCFEAIVYSKSLKRNIKLVGVQTQQKGKQSHKLYFTTDLQMDAQDVLEKYGARFQIEFLFRDAKQHLGLEHCQARDNDKLHFHWNASLTSVNLARVAHWTANTGQEKEPFSMADVKTFYHNKLLLDLFLAKFAIKPNKPKNQKKIRELLSYGARAA